MATGFSRKIRPTAVPEAGADPVRSAAPRRRKWLLVLAGLLLLLAIAPWIVAATSLRNAALAMALAPEQGTATSESGSLGWFSAPSLSNVTIRDPQGEVLLSARSVTVQKSLINLLLDWTMLDTIQIEAPELFLRLHAEGSNVETFIAPWLAPSDDDQPTRLALVLEVTDGAIQLSDATSGESWELEQLDSRLAMSTFDDSPLRFQASAALAGQPAPSPLHVELSMPIADDATGPTEIKLQTERFPLAAVQTLLARYVAEAELAGELTTQLACQWRGGDDLTIEGDLLASNLQLQAALLGDDRIELERLRVPCRVSYKRHQLTIEQLQAECDLGELEITGTVRTEGISSAALASELAHQPLRVHGRLDLVRLAAMLPNTLHLRPGTVVTSGALELSLESSTEQKGHRWQGRLVAQELAAVSGQRKFNWPRPIEIVLDARQDGDALVVEQLRCDSEFLQITAAGTPRALTGTAQVDLNLLVDQLAQIVDFGGWTLSGAGEADFRWSCTPEGAFEAGANLTLHHFQLAGPGRPPWIEEQLAIEASAAGGIDGMQLRRVQTATLRVRARDDLLDAGLREPVEGVSAASAWPLQVALRGELARWLPRLQPIVTLPDCSLSGTCDLSGQLIYASEQVEIEQLQASLQQFVLDGFGLHIAEPKVELAGQGRWNGAESRLDVPNLTLASSAVSLRAEQLAVKLPGDAPPALSGTVTLQGSLERLQRWFDDPQHAAPYRLVGEIAGQVKLARASGETTAQLRLDGEDLRLVEQVASRSAQPTSRPVWSEAELAIDASATYREAADHLQLHKLRLTSNTLGLSGAGTIDKLTSEQVLDLTGTLSYQLAQLMPLLEPYVGRSVQLEGSHTTPFTIQGPLASAVAQPAAHWSQRLSASAGLGWQRGQVYGLELGPAKLDAQLGQGMLTVRPFEIAVSEGRLSSAPRVQFDPAPAQLLLPAGPLVSQVRITPEMCDRALKFIAPVLADATRTEGRLSLELEGGRIPLDNAQTADLAGRLTIHQVDVLPGPLAQQFILLAKQIEAIANRQPPPLVLEQDGRALLELENQNIDFRVVEGRVYHRNLQIKAGDVVITTHGSVGFDESLALIAEVPIQDAWVSKDPIARSLSGKTIQVAIHGTLRRPQLDRRSIEQLAGQMLRGAAQEVLTNELHKQLDKLFK